MEVTTQNTATKTTSIEPGIQLINSIEQGNPKSRSFFAINSFLSLLQTLVSSNNKSDH